MLTPEIRTLERIIADQHARITRLEQRCAPSLPYYYANQLSPPGPATLQNDMWSPVPTATIALDTAVAASSDGNGNFVCPIAGWYEIEAGVQFESNSSGAARQVAVGINGKQIDSTIQTVATVTATWGPSTTSFDQSIQLALGDVVAAFAYQKTGQSLKIWYAQLRVRCIALT